MTGWFPDPEGGEHNPSAQPFEAPTEPIPAVASDEYHGPGWWQASDGRWYPPESYPDVTPSGAVSGRPPSYRRRGLVAGLVVLVLLVGIAVLSTKSKNTPVTVASATTTTSALASLTPVPTAPSTTATTLPATTMPPTTTPVTVATTTPTTAAAIATTAPPVTAVADLCGAPPNPLGYNFCNRGSFITSPDPSTCRYFTCIASFANGKGYMVECADAEYSMSGGRSGACSSHGGELRPVYSGP